ncbi:MAG: aminoacyl-tRNA hydrolase [Anaerolineae bacterium]|nr:aminoacyl-tRNA hydrolase [Anaerolineae bacterium]
MDRYLIVGLGNPGREYAETRHNIGFRCVDELARLYGLAFARVQHRALTTDGLIAGRRAALAKPQTYMNLSGESVGALVRFYKLPLENLIVVHDDLDLPLGTVRLRKQGGAGGQKGMRSIIQHLGADEFARVRAGIGRPPGRMDPADYVLQKFDAGELPVVEEVMGRVVRALETWLREGIEIAMTRYNGSVIPEPEAEQTDERRGGVES